MNNLYQFQINSNPKHRVYVVDDFYQNPFAIRQFAQTLEYFSDLNYFNKLNNKIRNFKNIKYKGALYKNKIQRLSVYDIFIFPSKSENFGLVILEALASGLYLILNNNLPWQHLSQKGFATLINFEKNSLKKEIKNLEKIKKKIRSPEYINKSYLYLSTNYSWKEISNEYVVSYNKVLKKR